MSCLMQVPFGFISRWYYNLGYVDHCSHPTIVIITECRFDKGIKRLPWQSRSHFTITHGKWMNFIHPSSCYCWIQINVFLSFLNVKEKEVSSVRIVLIDPQFRVTYDDSWYWQILYGLNTPNIQFKYVWILWVDYTCHRHVTAIHTVCYQSMWEN